MSFSEVIIQGRLTKDCELRYSQQGKAILQNGIAFDRYSVSNQTKKTVFLDFIASGKVAENIQKYFSKGSLILLLGELDQTSWTDKNTGQQKSKHCLMVNRFDFCGSSQKQQVQGQTGHLQASVGSTQNQQQYQQTQTLKPSTSDSFDDVPF